MTIVPVPTQRLRSLLVLVAFVTAGYACAPRLQVHNLYDVQRDVERYIASGEYDRDFARVVGE